MRLLAIIIVFSGLLLGLFVEPGAAQLPTGTEDLPERGREYLQPLVAFVFLAFVAIFFLVGCWKSYEFAKDPGFQQGISALALFILAGLAYSPATLFDFLGQHTAARAAEEWVGRESHYQSTTTGGGAPRPLREAGQDTVLVRMGGMDVVRERPLPEDFRREIYESGGPVAVEDDLVVYIRARYLVYLEERDDVQSARWGLREWVIDEVPEVKNAGFSNDWERLFIESEDGEYMAVPLDDLHEET